MLRLSCLLAIAAVVALTACKSSEPTGAITGEVRFARETALPEGVVVNVRLLDTSMADASSIELGRDVIENAGRLPVSFRVEYDRDLVSDLNEYSLGAEVRHEADLLYVNETVQPVLTRGAPGNLMSWSSPLTPSTRASSLCRERFTLK